MHCSSVRRKEDLKEVTQRALVSSRVQCSAPSFSSVEVGAARRSFGRDVPLCHRSCEKYSQDAGDLPSPEFVIARVISGPGVGGCVGVYESEEGTASPSGKSRERRWAAMMAWARLLTPSLR